MSIDGHCAQCGEEILIRVNRLKPLNFCSRACGARYSGAHPTPAMQGRWAKRKTGQELPCQVCGALTYLTAARLLRLESGEVKLTFCSPSCASSYYSSRRIGPLGGNWKGGVSIYPRAFKEARVVVLERDGHQCQGDGPHSGRMEIHHLDGDKHNTDVANLTTLCAKCHKRIHRWCRV